MAIFLFTDFGASDIYVGQVKSALLRDAPDIPVIDLLHEAPPCNVRAGAHLLAALSRQILPGSVTLAVVDPGVGGGRHPVMVQADGNWFVGPDNGLLSVVAARAQEVRASLIEWRPQALSESFHGRDLFAPVAAMLARGDTDAARKAAMTSLDVEFGGADLAEVIYIDHYGNAVTGLRASGVAQTVRLVLAGRSIDHARVFTEAAPGEVFWYENSLGLVEIAANAASAAMKLGLEIGQPVDIDMRKGTAVFVDRPS
ncbi:MAG: SAM-dependent chlorinase/fluorinase [Betaproteobacteria bacterium]|nr:SAM-dependent chlorinase/fluorinase [Betaproteobacteria bacterium]